MVNYGRATPATWPDTLIEVLSELRRFLGGEKASLLGGRAPGAPQHRDAGLAGDRAVWLVVEHLPPLRANSTPTEGLWSSLKAIELANLTSTSLAEVIDQAHRGIERSAHPALGLLVPAPDRHDGPGMSVPLTHQLDTQDP